MVDVPVIRDPGERLNDMELAHETELTVTAEPSEALLERHLAMIGEADAALADRIRAAPVEPLDIEWADDGHVTATWRGRRLASARRPGEEAARVLEGLDLHAAALVGICGFGLGHHVAAVARRMRGTGVVLVLETDLALLRAVFSRIDATGWMKDDRVRIVDDPNRATLARRLRGLDSLLMVGIRIVEHPPSTARIGEAVGEFARGLGHAASTARMNVATALIRGAKTLDNALGNLPGYVACDGIDDLVDAARGRLGVVVSAGPSLRRNIGQLARPGVRERCVVIATQTTLKPLLAAGVAPHFVTAIDHHSISRRFHEGIDPEMVRDTELVVDPRVNPAVVEAWPGRLRLNRSADLERVLGPLGRRIAGVPLASTVAHLCHSLARHLGCDPVALIGQDLGFTDGLYYAPDNAIHEIWTPEFNAFNTIETMEWERIARHRAILSERVDVHGRRIFTDAQMETYLQRFEFMFADDAARGLTTIDATEGGVRKQGTGIATLEEVLEAHADPSSPVIDLPTASPPDPSRFGAVVDRLEDLRREVREIGDAAAEAQRILGRMKADARDLALMNRHFEELEHHRRAVEARPEAFGLIEVINQIGVFKRTRADRSIRLAHDLPPVERQAREIDRDLANVEWTEDASGLLGEMLERAVEHLRTGDRREAAQSPADLERTAGIGPERGDDRRVFAMIPVDPERGGTGVARPLDVPFGNGTLLQEVLERIGRSDELAGIVLLVPDGLDLEPLLDVERVDLPITVHRCGPGVFPPAHEMIRAVRATAPTSWRGGPLNLGIHDEVLVPGHSSDALRVVEGDAIVPIGPDWPLIPIRGDHGIDAVVRRWRDRPSGGLVFVQAPPGLGASLVSADLLDSLARIPTRRATVGHQLGYRPELPQSDPITDEACIVPPASVRDAVGRFVADSSRQRDRLHRVLEGSEGEDEPADVDVVTRFESGLVDAAPMTPQFVRIELCTDRIGRPRSLPPGADAKRPPMDEATFRAVVESLGEAGDVVATFDGAGDPLLHPRFDDYARIAIDAGVRLVGVRTDLMVDPDLVDRLLAAPIEVVEVDLDAETAGTHRRMHGVDRFDQVRANLARIVAGRRLLATATPLPDGIPIELRPGLPVVVPRILRCEETIDEIPEFFERWRTRLGAAVIDGAPRGDAHEAPESLSSTRPPARFDRLVATNRLTVLADGSVPFRETDLEGREIAGRIGDRPLLELWQAVVQWRRGYEMETGSPPAPWRA